MGAFLFSVKFSISRLRFVHIEQRLLTPGASYPMLPRILFNKYPHLESIASYIRMSHTKGGLPHVRTPYCLISAVLTPTNNNLSILLAAM